MPGIGIVLNPHSKKNRQEPERMKKIAFIVGDKAACAQTQDFDHLERVAEEFKERDIDILGISGGDGTNHKTLSTFIDVYGDQPLPKIAFLKGGTMNFIANSCGARGSSEKIISNLIYKYHEDIPFETFTLHPLNVNGHHGFVWGCGFIYRLMEAFYKGKALSEVYAIKIFLKTVASALVNGKYACRMFERFDAEVSVDGEKWDYKNYSSVFAGAIQNICATPFVTVKIFHHVLKEPTKFHAMGFSLFPRGLLTAFPRAFLGLPTKQAGIIEAPANEMEVKLAKPMMYTVDGDRYGPTDHIKVTQGPELTIIKS
jgi:diacylglycerol kinase (ATP)